MCEQALEASIDVYDAVARVYARETNEVGDDAAIEVPRSLAAWLRCLYQHHKLSLLVLWELGFRVVDAAAMRMVADSVAGNAPMASMPDGRRASSGAVLGALPAPLRRLWAARRDRGGDGCLQPSVHADGRGAEVRPNASGTDPAGGDSAAVAAARATMPPPVSVLSRTTDAVTGMFRQASSSTDWDDDATTEPEDGDGTDDDEMARSLQRIADHGRLRRASVPLATALPPVTTDDRAARVAGSTTWSSGQMGYLVARMIFSALAAYGCKQLSRPARADGDGAGASTPAAAVPDDLTASLRDLDLTAGTRSEEPMDASATSGIRRRVRQHSSSSDESFEAEDAQ